MRTKPLGEGRTVQKIFVDVADKNFYDFVHVVVDHAYPFAA